MKRMLMLYCFFCVCLPLRAQTLTAEEINFFTQQLAEQQKAWNAGDLDGYMSYYWGSDSLIFITHGKRVTGWQTIRDSYENKYPDPTQMGTLEFSNLYFYKIDKNTVITTGLWKLNRNDNQQEGSFTLLWKKLKGRWVIVLDHTN